MLGRRKLPSYLVGIVHLFEHDSTMLSLAHIRVKLQTSTARQISVRVIATRLRKNCQKIEYQRYQMQKTKLIHHSSSLVLKKNNFSKHGSIFSEQVLGLQTQI